MIEFAKGLGVIPEIVQIPTSQGIEIHVLLICEHAEELPLRSEPELLAGVDEQINLDSIRHVFGRLNAA